MLNLNGQRTAGRRQIALLAIFALVLQAMLPSVVVFAASSSLTTIVVCTPAGLLQVTPSRDGQPAHAPEPNGHCPICFATQAAAAVPPQPSSVMLAAETFEGVDWRHLSRHVRTSHTAIPPPARGPPAT